MEVLKNILKYRRTTSNLSQREVAEKVKISQVGYSKIESGENIPSLKTCLKLAVVLGFNMEDLKESVRKELR